MEVIYTSRVKGHTQLQGQMFLILSRGLGRVKIAGVRYNGSLVLFTFMRNWLQRSL